MSLSKKLTIVIPCKNEGLTIKKTLELLNHQSDIENVSVIVADISDDKFTKKILEEDKYFFKLKVVKGGLPSVARNNGFKFCKTPYVLFLDADIFLLDNELLINSVRHIEFKNKDLISCKFNTSNGKYNYVYNLFYKFQKLTKWVSPFCLGGFMLIKSKKFKEIGGFDEKLTIAEDYQLTRKISSNKFDVLNNVVFTTPRRFDNKGLLYMFKIFIGSYINRNDTNYFKYDKNYWS
jgi:glycosyltransferase involved in cell wall biosynthesis